MITERPLKEVATRALYALHRGIERQAGLITGRYLEKNHTCAIGSLLDRTSKQEPYCQLRSLGIFHLEEHNGVDVADLNDRFEGTPEKRREFMLRHIVEELRQRSKPLPNKSDQATKILTHET